MANNNDKKVLNVPALRFPEFTGEWENITIREACSEFQSGKNIKAEMINDQGLILFTGEMGYVDLQEVIIMMVIIYLLEDKVLYVEMSER